MVGSRPRDVLWIAAIHQSEDDFAPLGTAVVIDERRVLTSAHVVRNSKGVIRERLWVAFPMCEDPTVGRRAAASVRGSAHAMADLAVIELVEPVPAGVRPAPLRCPKPSDVAGRDWWAFGFARQDPRGNEAEGTVGASLGYGWVRLDAESRYHVEPGFSGSGLWCGDYGAVVAVVGEANDRGDGRAITMHHADGYMPAEKIQLLTTWTLASADELARAAWGWTLGSDREADRHWRPRARGVAGASERGNRFRGRRRPLTEIVAWLDRHVPNRRVLVVTGSPGVGKSAVLGRVVTTADPAMRVVMPAEDDAPRATVGSVACAVHAKGKTALDVAIEIARAASTPIPERVEDLPPSLRDVLSERGRIRFNLVIDALDEASDPTQARRIITGLTLPIATTCADVGAQVLVGTRRSDDAGDLIRVFGLAQHLIDLDEERYFDIDDLAAYAQATLQLRGDERPGNPYQSDAVAVPVARRIAALADRNFLVAGMVARAHGLYDEHPAALHAVTFTSDLDAALSAFLDRLAPVAGVPARTVLTALAFAEAPGFSFELWRLAVSALFSVDVSLVALRELVMSSAANFLVESTDAPYAEAGLPERSFRLFHQALADALVHDRARLIESRVDERTLVSAFMHHGTSIGWAGAPTYLFRSLPGHAVRAGMVDMLLADGDFVLNADLQRLVPAAAHSQTSIGREMARLLRLAPRALTAAPPDRLAMFSITEAVDGNDRTFRDHPAPSPYRGIWARMRRRVERTVLEGHTGGVAAVCAIQLSSPELLVSGGADGTVRVWDPATGTLERILRGHSAAVVAVCPLHLDGCKLASAGADATVRVWDPATGALIGVLNQVDRVRAVCPIRVDGRELLATAGGYDATVRIWDPVRGSLERVLRGHTDRVRAVCRIRLHGRELLASAGGYDATVRLWDPATGTVEQILEGHAGGVRTVCAIEVNGRELLASAGDDTAVRVWDATTGELTAVLRGHADRIVALCPISVDGRALLASAGHDWSVRVWDPVSGTPDRVLHGHTDRVWSVASIAVDRRELLASAGNDATVRIWDLTSEARTTPAEVITDPVRAVCRIRIDGRELLTSAGDDATVRMWDPATGTLKRVLKGHTGGVRAVCPIRVDGRELLASAGDDATVRVWDPATDTVVKILEGHIGWVQSVCPIRVGDDELLASAGGYNATVQIWDLAAGARYKTLDGHTDRVRVVCPIQANGRELLASAGADGAVRVWDPAKGAVEQILVGHTGGVVTMCAIQADARILLASAGDDATVRIWDLATGTVERILEAHTAGVVAMCAIHAGGRGVLASTGNDRAVRIWDPTTWKLISLVPVPSDPSALTAVGEAQLAVGTVSGLLSLRISPDFQHRPSGGLDV